MREFLRGPLARVSYELDTAYYGTVAYNRRVMLEWTVDVVFAFLRQIGIMRYGEATPSPEEDVHTLTKPRPKLENTYHWINKLHHIEDSHTIGQMAGWESFCAWRLDVLLGLAAVPPYGIKAFTLYMDGFDRSEIAKRLPAAGGQPWDDNSVRSALKEASGVIRRRSELHWPAKGAPRIREIIPTQEIRRVEAAIAKVRGSLEK